MADPFIGCSLLELPEDQRVEAANEAVRQNPRNRPSEEAIRALIASLRRWQEPEKIAAPIPDEEEEVAVEPQHIAMITTKHWGPVVDLGVTFLDTQDAALKKRILEFMNHWGKWGSIRFRESAGGQVRIARQQGRGYWSYLGTDILQLPAPQPTMNLDSWSFSKPESEWFRVIEHETGHTLGFPHEHMRPEIVAQLDAQKCISYFGRTQGWSPQMVMQQVLTPLKPSTLTAGPVDEYSIMCYQLPGTVTKDGQPIPGGARINEADGAFAGAVYPKAASEGEGPPASEGTTVVIPKAGTYRLVE